MGYYQLDKIELNEGIVNSINKSRKLLHDTRQLLNDKWEHSHAIGLYTFAIEEYGRAILLKNCLKKKPMTRTGKYKVPRPIFESHKLKFETALKKLPPKCKNLQIGPHIKQDPLSKPIRTRGLTIIRGRGLHTVSTLADFDLRMELFYVEWDDKYRQWKPELTTYKKQLETAITNLENRLNIFLVKI